MTEQPTFAPSMLPAVYEPIPRSIVLAAWANSWIDGSCSGDDITHALEQFGPQRFLAPGSEGTAPTGLLVGLSDLGLRPGNGKARLRVVLPTPGDPSGLPGPPAVNREAIAAGQAIVADDEGVTFLPLFSELVTTWTAFATPAAAAPTMAIRPEQAAAAVKRALLDATAQLADLDLAAGRDDVAELLMELNIRMKRVKLPASLPGAAQHTIHSAAQILGIAEIALAAAKPALTTNLERQRHSVLTELATTARHCLAAAVSPR